MAELILFCALVGLGIMLYQTRDELSRLRRRLTALEYEFFHLLDRLDGQTQPEAEPEKRADPEPIEPIRVAAKATARRTAVVAGSDLQPPTEPAISAAPSEPAYEPEPDQGFKNPLAGASFEDLVGGKLPIWIGGIALVFAGFFLVRYTIEAGLLGPGARSILATVFAFILIALSEFGGRLPKLGESFKADPRVAQSLAGAGVATLYGTLYMASEIYGLIGVMTAFALVVVVTAIAFTLSLRHGPPTALMGLIGGFAAPWVAGMGASNLPTLLLYLAVFIAALFGLAVWRRWLWLLVLASGGGALWSIAMLFSADGDFALLGLFILAAGGGAIFAFDRFKDVDGLWSEVARYAPIALALIQLAILLPQMDFSVIAWLFYAVISIATIALAWRDKRLLPVVAAAFFLALGPLYSAWSSEAFKLSTTVATFGLALLFGAAGHAGVQRNKVPTFIWAAIGLAAPILCWFTAIFAFPDAASKTIWGTTALLTALPAAWLAWNRHQRRETGIIQIMASGTTALMALLAADQFSTGGNWAGCLLAIDALGLAAWARVTGSVGVRRLAIFPLGGAMLWAAVSSYQFIEALLSSLAGEKVLMQYLPDMADATQTTLLPALLILAILVQPIFTTGKRTRIAAWVAGGVGVTAILWMLAKHVADIQTPANFITLGFAERAMFTQLLFAGAWLALRETAKRPLWSALKPIGLALAAIALFRVIWFDLLLLNPVFVAQAVGPVPVANLASGHLALTAIWLWLFGNQLSEGKQRVGFYILSLSAMILTVLATVRQAMQGSIMSGGAFTTGENYLYSAALLALAIAWLARGMMAGSRLLRIAGLALLTAVTLKVFLVDAAALEGVLRILSFLGLGIALIGIGWAYGRVMGTAAKPQETA
jgi:hypothetical protein